MEAIAIGPGVIWKTGAPGAARCELTLLDSVVVRCPPPPSVSREADREATLLGSGPVLQLLGIAHQDPEPRHCAVEQRADGALAAVHLRRDVGVREAEKARQRDDLPVLL